MRPTIHSRLDPDGVMSLWLDQPDRSVNTLTPEMLEELEQVISEIEGRSDLQGLLIGSSKPRSFMAGADLFAFRGMSESDLLQYVQRGQDLMNRIARLPIPSVAAINGSCLGGGLELALACRSRVAADKPSIEIGLPEVKLGIIPAWGGSVRLPRLIGLGAALALMLAGKTLPPRKAMQSGIVDEVVRPEALYAAAKRHLRWRTRHQPGTVQWAMDHVAPIRRRIFETARQRTEKRTHGHYPAPIKLIDVVQTGYDKGIEAGLKAERDALGELVHTNTTRNLMRLFFLRHDAKRTAATQFRISPIELMHVAVIGGGVMGSGIAHALSKAGLFVRLIDVNHEQIQQALRRVSDLLAKDLSAGRLTRLQVRDAMHRICPTTQWRGLRLADVVIEAAGEDMAIKREIFGRLDRQTRPEAVLASNTSSLSITQMAQGLTGRRRVVGLHFFNPVPMMPLVEVVRTPYSNDESLVTALNLAARLGKVPVLVNDSPGFVVNRLLIPYLAEALVMAGEGGAVEHIDQSMRQWGMPMGPFELLDQIGLDVAAAVLESLFPHMSDRVVAPDAIREALQHGWLGRKTGQGFYVYRQARKLPWQDSQPPQVNEPLVRLLSPAAAGNIQEDGKQPDVEDVQWRLVLLMVNEAARLLGEQVIESADQLDLAAVLGMGFAPFRGGVVHFADQVGARPMAQRMHKLAVEHGTRFTPAQMLRQAEQQNLPLSQIVPVAPPPGEPKQSWTARVADESRP